MYIDPYSFSISATIYNCNKVHSYKLHLWNKKNNCHVKTFYCMSRQILIYFWLLFQNYVRTNSLIMSKIGARGMVYHACSTMSVIN